ncbi:alpha/beta hydrolase [Cytobacillus sp. FSL K6-0129]|uniref:alpha/beta hydrolase n=1 Tax=Cytobacillus sp. FSL K6-0129 TaxID=2921421 RepID=UPI0030F66C5B
MVYIDINNKKIEILYKGVNKPTILILSGMGCSIYEWDKIITKLSNKYRVLMYHRPGLGESEYTNDTRATLKVTQEIIYLLEYLDINEPIILVGHSYGGLCAQHFTKLYPDKIRGLLLLDSTSVNLHKLDQLELPYMNENDSDIAWIEKCKRYSSLSPEELYNTLNPILTDKQRMLSVETQKKIIAFYTNPTLYKTMIKEIENWKSDAEIIKNIKFRGAFPVTIIGRDKGMCVSESVQFGNPINEAELLEQTWHELIIEQKHLYKNAKLTFAINASHDIHLDQPNLVTNEIIEMINKTNFI